ncbi:hypothetical protein FOXYSP1_20392 [Fusarium oxysporum f. sp. phaseoli]
MKPCHMSGEIIKALFLSPAREALSSSLQTVPLQYNTYVFEIRHEFSGSTPFASIKPR